MKIKFKAPDPRAGSVVQLDSSRAQHFIDTGAAVLVKDDDHRSTVARAELDKALASIPRDETDADYLVGAMRAHFKDAEISNELVTSYFDKLIQVPLQVPRLGTTEVKAYLVLLLTDLARRRKQITDKTMKNRKSTRLNSSHTDISRMPSSA